MATPTRVLSLCSGIGALDHGIRLACPTARTVCLVEGEAFCVASLVAQMSRGELDEAPVWSDLTTFDGLPWRGVVDTVVAGFPCQPASVAGSRRGTADKRWLWRDVQRIVGEVQPRWVFLENVPGLLTAPGTWLGESDCPDAFRGGAVGEVLGGLASLGFAAEWCCVPASAVGSPQGRMRWFCLAHCERAEWWSEDVSGGRLEQGQHVQGQAAGSAGERGPVVGDADSTRKNARASGGRSRRATGESGGVVGNAHNAGPQGHDTGALMQGRDELPDWPPGPADGAGWELVLARHPDLAPALPTELAVCLLADGRTVQSDNTHRVDRLRALGNACVPAQAALAFTIMYHRICNQK